MAIVEIKQTIVNQLICIKNCPWCGEKPNVFTATDNRYKSGEQNWVIECKELGCLMHRTSPDRCIENLLSRWNKRKEIG